MRREQQLQQEEEVPDTRIQKSRGKDNTKDDAADDSSGPSLSTDASSDASAEALLQLSGEQQVDASIETSFAATDFALPDHPLWKPQPLCNSESKQIQPYPALNFCPPVKAPYHRTHYQRTTGSIPPENYWMLDAPAVMSTIAQQVQPSMWLLNLGANPSSLGEDGERREIVGDDCTPLWSMGYHGVNFDIPQNAQTMQAFYAEWPNAIVDATGSPPPRIVERLQHHNVPKDVDFLKIDVDSFDCVFLSEILSAGYTPKAMSLELAAPWPPPLKFMVTYSDSFSYQASTGTAMSGCSLQAAADIVKPYGYTLLQYAMEDGWFVQNEYVHLFGAIETDLVKIWDAGNPAMYAQFAWHAPPGVRMVEELKDLRSDPAKMLEKAEKGVEHLVGQTPALGTAKYSLTI